ncbi:hypothetical protein NQ315_004911 [Exocentrus adspersus]|uniref:J domain-containing protein n=1 Tax=Exocentrus adspersus TaxID=1586481 RepID=A0AAV8W2H2_9CUCU|nr:hypothetical protein NQ315_004911 [Exocentrus adspersus]
MPAWHTLSNTLETETTKTQTETSQEYGASQRICAGAGMCKMQMTYSEYCALPATIWITLRTFSEISTGCDLGYSLSLFRNPKMGLDYYGILQIPKTSTDLQIKKAYRNLALEFHPEILKNDSAKQVFRLLGEAYDVLSHPLHRAIFDQYGEEGLKRGVPTTEEYIPAYHYHGDPMLTYK